MVNLNSLISVVVDVVIVIIVVVFAVAVAVAAVDVIVIVVLVIIVVAVAPRCPCPCRCRYHYHCHWYCYCYCSVSHQTLKKCDHWLLVQLSKMHDILHNYFFCFPFQENNFIIWLGFWYKEFQAKVLLERVLMTSLP